MPKAYRCLFLCVYNTECTDILRIICKRCVKKRSTSMSIPAYRDYPPGPLAPMEVLKAGQDRNVQSNWRYARLFGISGDNKKATVRYDDNTPEDNVDASRIMTIDEFDQTF